MSEVDIAEYKAGLIKEYTRIEGIANGHRQALAEALTKLEYLRGAVDSAAMIENGDYDDESESDSDTEARVPTRDTTSEPSTPIA